MDEALAINPTLPDANFKKGFMMYTGHGDRAEAVEYYKKAIQYGYSHSAICSTNIAAYYTGIDKPEETICFFELKEEIICLHR